MSARLADLVVVGAADLAAAPGAPISPARWAGAPAKLARMDRLSALGLVACDQALLDAGLRPGDGWDGERTAVALGTAYGCHAVNEDYYRGFLKEGLGGASPRLFAYTLPSSPVGEISIHYGIRGPAYTGAAGLHAGLAALGAGLRDLLRGRADLALVAAAEVATPLLATLLGGGPLEDGGAALVLERADRAAARGAVPLGWVRGTAETHRPGARASAVTEAARRALTRADLGLAGLRRVIAAAADLPALRALGIGVEATLLGERTLAAEPLGLAGRWLREGRGPALVVAADPEGGAAAAVLEADPGA